MESYNLQLIPGGVPLVIHASQYDSAREYTFTPLYGSAPYSYQSGAKVYVEATKPDRTVVQEVATYNTDGTVFYKPSEVLFQAAGDVRAKVTFVDKSEHTLASATITIAVDLSGITTYAQISQSDMSLIHAVGQKISTIDDSVTESQTQATRSKSWAVGPSGTGTDGTDSNNSWYWSKQSAASATAAKTSETNAASSASAAKTSETNAKSWAVGPSGTGTAGIDTNNAKYWAEQAKTAVTGVVTLNDLSGAVTISFDESTGDIKMEA